jgi:acetyl esterase/lipase
MGSSKRLLVLAVVAAAAVVLSGCLVPRPPGASALALPRHGLQHGSRSRRTSSTAAPVNSSGVNQALLLDLRQPTGDTRTSRPALVFVHGGGFSGGDKASASRRTWPPSSPSAAT